MRAEVAQSSALNDALAVEPVSLVELGVEGLLDGVGWLRVR